MKYRIIIPFFINFLVLNVYGQDLEEVVPRTVPSSSTSKIEPNLSDLPVTTKNEALLENELNESINENPNLTFRASTTYKKEEYLHEVIRQEYYQRIMTNPWSKYFNGAAWKRNVLKSHYWSQLRNYLSGNDKNVIVIRTPVVKDSMIKDALLDPHRLILNDSILPENFEDTMVIGTLPMETLTLATNDKINLESVPSSKTDPNIEKINKRVDINEENHSPIVKTNVQKEIKVASKPAGAALVSTTKGTTLNGESISVVSTPSVTPLNFSAMKGRLPWPVSSGQVTDRFGIRKNAEARGLRPENYGIDMVCPGGAVVQAISSGTVLLAKRQSPYDYIVTIKHGQFTTAYYFLITPYVKAGDQITSGQNIGQLRTSVKQADFHFEIWQNQDRVNPELWLKKR